MKVQHWVGATIILGVVVVVPDARPRSSEIPPPNGRYLARWLDGAGATSTAESTASHG
jgi:hypothetical protein